MQLGIIIEQNGTFIFKIPEDNTIITMSYVQKNMLGWLFHVPNIYDYISLLPIEKYLVSFGVNDINSPLKEITEDKAQEFYSTLITFQEEKNSRS